MPLPKHAVLSQFTHLTSNQSNNHQATSILALGTLQVWYARKIVQQTLQNRSRAMCITNTALVACAITITTTVIIRSETHTHTENRRNCRIDTVHNCVGNKRKGKC